MVHWQARNSLTLGIISTSILDKKIKDLMIKSEAHVQTAKAVIFKERTENNKLTDK